MNLSDSIRPECIQIGSTVKDKMGVLREIARLAKKSAVLSAYTEDNIFKALAAREDIGSTGFEKGIAIPHCSFENLDEFVVGILIVPQGIDFQALDNRITNIFFFIIGPKERSNDHIQLLSAISKISKTREAIDKLLKAHDTQTLLEQLTNLVQYRVEGYRQKGKCLFHVFIQKEEYFEDILQVFSEMVEGTLAVIETNNAGYYLHTMPLFAAYWSENKKTFSRIILAVADKDLCNEIIRRINMIAEDIDKVPGILISVQDLIFTSGTIEF